jgi:small subunit ribosomal protein S20
MRGTERRSKRNLDVKTRLKTVYKKAAAEGGELVQPVESQFDKAARKGIIHPNKAARKKSRLAKAVAKISGSAAPIKKTSRKKAAPKTSRKKKAAK